MNYIEKSSKEQKIEKELYEERQKGTKPKSIAKGENYESYLENMLFIEREKRNKLMAKKRGSEGSKIGVGIILGYKYLNGYAEGYAETAVQNNSVQTNSLEIGLRINW